MTEELLALIKHRLKQADDSIEEAEVLLKEKMSLRAVMNRLYYSMFYAVLALLQEKQLGTSKHIGAISLFDREFIKTGIFDNALSKTLHRAFELRQKGDYPLWNRLRLQRTILMRCCQKRKPLSTK